MLDFASPQAGAGRQAQDEINTVLPAPWLVVLGLQHVLVMYANAIALPLIIGGAFKMPKDQIALLINADLFACGIATLIQTVGLGPFGIRLPVIMGVTAVAIQPILAMATMPGIGLDGIYDAVLAGGAHGLLVVPFVGRLMRFLLRGQIEATELQELAVTAEAAQVAGLGQDGQGVDRADAGDAAQQLVVGALRQEGVGRDLAPRR